MRRRRVRRRPAKQWPTGTGCLVWLGILAMLPAAAFTVVVVFWGFLIYLGVAS